MANVDAIASDVAKGLDGGRVSKSGTSGIRTIEGRRRDLHVRVSCWYSNNTHGWSVETKGAIVDLGTGDPALDRDWLVEGAPVATARQVLDDELRKRLAGALDFTIEIDGGEIKVSDRPNTYGPEEVDVGIDLALVVRARLAAMAKDAPSDEGSRREADRAIAELRVK